MERKHGDFVRGLITSGAVNACHDIADGGLLVALAEMAMAGGRGAKLSPPDSNIPLFAWAFGEDQARYLITSNDPTEIVDKAAEASVPIAKIGMVQGSALTLGDGNAISLENLIERHQGWFPSFMATTGE